MAIVTTPKERSSSSSTPSSTPVRQQVSMGKPSGSTARAEALKARLSGKAPSEPIAPRPAGSSARREEMAKLQKFQSQAPAPTQPPRGSANTTSARNTPADLANIEPPPSGAVAPKQVNTGAEEPTPDTAEATSDPMSPQLAALARKERQIRKAQQDLKAAQDAWKQDQAKHISKDRLLSEPLKVLAEAGITPDRLVELQLNQGETTSSPQDPQQVLLSEINALKQQIKDLVDPENGTLAKRDQADYEQAVSQIRQDAKLLVDSNPAYGTIKSEGKTEDVVELVTRVFNEEGVVLDVEEAANLIEEKLVDRLTKQYERLQKLDKFKTKFGQPSETEEANDAQQPHESPPPQKTLTNALGSQRPMSAKERAVRKVQEMIDARRRNQ